MVWMGVTMGIIKAFSGAIRGTFADQWKEIITAGSFGARTILESMKKDAVLVNIARGGLVDTEDLIEVLKDRQDLFAALDVFEEEPLPQDSMLWSLPNVAVSPHNSFVSDGNNERMFSVIYNNLKQYLGK